MNRPLGALVLIVIASAASPRGQTLPDLAREHRGISGITNSATEPIDLLTLVRRSQLIARVTVAKADAHLTPNQKQVMTDYTVLVMDIEHSKGSVVRLGEAIVVSRLGGETVIDGFRAKWTASGFPDFLVGEEYVLFLGESSYPIDDRFKASYPGLKRFGVLSHAWGAFKFGPDSIRQVGGTETEGWNGRQPAPVLTFLNELRSTVAQVREESPQQ